jgi:PAS domain S-box-containing protein
MIPLPSMVNWITAMIVGGFSAIIFLGSDKRSTRMYAIVAFFVQIWAIGVGAYFYTETAYWVIFWNRFNHVAAVLIAGTYFLFALTYPSDKKVPRKILATVFAAEAILVYLYFFTQIGIRDTGFHRLYAIDRFNLFHAVDLGFYIPFGIFFGAAFWILYKNSLTATEKDRAQISTILVGSIIGFIPSLGASVIIPFLGYYGLYWMGPALALGWVTFILYAIAKHRILNVRVLFAEVSVLVMSIILLANVFLSDTQTFGITGRIFIFLAFGVIGAFFIRNIVQKEDQKEKLATLTKELEGLNASLETQVDERTRELTGQKVHTETIIENLTNGLIEYDKDLRIVRMNSAAERMLGMDRALVIGKTLPENKTPAAGLEAITQVTYPKYTTSSFANDVMTDEITVASLADQEFQIVTAPITASDNKAIGYIKIIRDITREKLVARGKTEFISIAAHQLRTPLAAIKWTLDVILEGDKGPLTELEKTPLSRAHETNEKMIDLVNDLLNVARIEDGRFGYKFAEHDLTSLIETAVADSNVNPKTEAPAVEFLLPEAPLPLVYCDPEKLSLAFHNLIDNALHYTPKEGKVTVWAGKTGEWLSIAVKDTGIGMNEADRAKLFTKFFRAESAKKMRTDGSGLGLYIVHNIIARHGGSIDVQSKEHEGTTFTVRLPLDKMKVPQAEETIYY